MTARLRTGFSFRQATGHLEEVIARVQEIGLSAAPITDTASTFGFVRWGKACKKAGLKPVFGVGLNVTDSIHAKKPASDEWAFIAKTSIRPLNDLVELATNQFRFTPLLTIEQALHENVFKVMGNRTVIDQVPVSDGLFLALGPSTSRGQLKAALKSGHRVIAASDNRYTNDGDQGFYEVLCGRNASLQTYSQHILSDDEWRDSVSWAPLDIIDQALVNRNMVYEASNAGLVPGQIFKPERPATLRSMCIDGAARLGVDLVDPVYAERLDRELALILEKGFEDYFYLIGDLCTWARSRMIVGPARGSSCGSLVCFLTGITLVDPIKYGLLFERFIDPNRADLADIDIDFSAHSRDLALDYLVQKYGQEHVARLGSVAFYKSKSALNEVGKALGIPPWDIDKVGDQISDYAPGDARFGHSIEDALENTAAGKKLKIDHPGIVTACRMENHPRHATLHAAGVVITLDPINEHVASDSKTGAINADKKDAEDLNLLKIDALGLTQLSIFEDALEMAGLPMHALEGIPLDDPEAFAVLNKGQFSGIFQFAGAALASITSRVEIKSLDDLVAITALGRPGPGNNVSQWIAGKDDPSEVYYPHPLFEPILKPTHGVIIYQEQCMKICRDIGQMSWASVNGFRRAVGKSMGREALEVYRPEWMEGAVKSGVSRETADHVWTMMCEFGLYSFNQSHSVAYSIISYQCCWLKAHYPLEFAAATLTHTTSEDSQIALLREMLQEGVSYVPVDKELSREKWTVGFKDGKKILVGPLGSVIGIGPKLVQQIVSARARNEPLPGKADKLLTNPKTKIDSLFPISDRIAEIMPDPSERNIHTKPTPIARVQVSGFKKEALVFGIFSSIKVISENELDTVAKRGYRHNGPSDAIKFWVQDDTDKIFAKIGRYDFERLAPLVLNKAKENKSIYAIKGTVPGDFRMISISSLRYIGEMTDEISTESAE